MITSDTEDDRRRAATGAGPGRGVGPGGAVGPGGRAARGAAVLLLMAAQACTNVIVPPESPHAPRSVFLLDHGRHASLVLPADDTTMVRYSYGDWRWYAERETGPLEGSSAVLWPTRAAFGRRELAAAATAPAVRDHVQVGIEALYEIRVEEIEIRRLRARLDSIHAANRDTRHFNSAYDLEFVTHPDAYHALHNSNHVVAGWLEALGCRIRGPSWFSRWRVEPPGDR